MDRGAEFLEFSNISNYFFIKATGLVLMLLLISNFYYTH